VICPINSYGCSTGLAPIQVKIINEIVNIQNINLDKGLNLFDKMKLDLKGRILMIRMEVINAMTPPNLLGIDRRIA